MKKIMLGLIAGAFTMSTVAADYPKACEELEDLTQEMAELSPEMAAALEEAGTEEERKEAARQAFAEMSDSEQDQAGQDCQIAIQQLEKIIEALKVQS